MTTLRFLLPFALLALLGCAATDLDVDADSIGTSDAAATSRGSFELWRASNDEYYFHLEAGNHEVLLASEGYKSRTGAINGILSVLNNGGLESRYEIFEGADGQYYVNLKAGNGQVIGSTEGYTTKQSAKGGVEACIRAVATYLEHWATNTGARFEVFEGKSGEFFFNLHAANGKIVLVSEAYQTEASALNGAFAVAENGIDPERYEVLEAHNGGFYFNLRAANNEIIGTSEIYSTRSNAQAGVNAVVNLLPEAELL